MENVTFVTFEHLNGVSEHAIIEHAPGEFTSMLKSTYDELQAKTIEGVN
jgi:hypothetical protein